MIQSRCVELLVRWAVAARAYEEAPVASRDPARAMFRGSGRLLAKLSVSDPLVAAFGSLECDNVFVVLADM